MRGQQHVRGLRLLRSGGIFVVALSWASLCGAAAAQQPATYSGAPVEIHIAAQPLPDALKTLADQTGLQFAYEGKIDSRLMAPRVSGTYSPEAALIRILEPSGLAHHYINERTVAIEGRPSSGNLTPEAQDQDGRQRGAKSQLASAEPQSSYSPALPASSLPAVRTPSGSDSPGGARLDEIIVTAQKREERLTDVPISISVVSGAGLDRSTLSGATDVLNTLPNVTAAPNYQGGGSLLAIRGVGAQNALNSGSSPIAYYLDGMPFALVKQAFVPSPDVFDLDRIEVLRGPQGTLYGANAENGVVRVLTHDADFNRFEAKARGLASTTDGGGGNYGGDLAVNAPIIEDKLAVRAVVDYSNLNGWIDSLVAPHINDSELKTGRIKINAQPTEQLSLALSAWTSRNKDGAPAGSDDNGRIAVTLRQFVRTDYDLYGAKLGYDLSQLSVSSTTSYLDFTNDGLFDVGPYAPVFQGVSAHQLFRDHVFSEEAILNSKETDVWRWTAGAFYRNGTDRYFQTISVLPTPVVNNAYSSESYAGFGEVSRRFFDRRLELTAGLRYFHDDVTVDGLNPPSSRTQGSFHATTPRGVLTWYPNSALTMYASYSQGFRSGFPQDPFVNEIAPQFPPVKPDKLHNYEIGAKGDVLDHRVSFETAVYYIDWKDVQQYVYVTFAGGLVYPANINAASASGPGFEFTVSARPLDGLTLSSDFGWNGLRLNNDVLSAGSMLFRRGDPLDATSIYTAGVSGAYEFPLGGSGLAGQFSVSANYNSKQLLHPAAGAPALTGHDQTIAHTGLSIVGPHKTWTATLFVDNLNNERAAIVPGTAPGLAVRVRPRTVGTQFEYRFK